MTRQERTRAPKSKIKVHEACGRPWAEHSPTMVGNRLQWVCPSVKA